MGKSVNNSQALVPARRPLKAVAPAGLSEEPEDTDIEKRETAAAGQMSDNPNFGREDIAIPRLKLGQGLTPDVVQGNAVIGQFILLGHDPVDSVMLIPKLWGKGRKLQDKDDFSVLCTSVDMTNGEGMYGPGSKENKYGKCATCPMNVWTENKKTGKRVPPTCTEYHSYAMWSVTHQCKVLVDFQKTAINTAKQLNTVIQQRKMGNFVIELTSETSQAGKNQYQVPRFKVISLEDEESELEAARVAFSV